MTTINKIDDDTLEEVNTTSKIFDRSKLEQQKALLTDELAKINSMLAYFE